tara:strand:- start:303 stop:479 length:177 start_codon:yes stop_codon:yes gene_type:complete
MAVRIKVMMTLHVDPEEYPMPSDDKVDEEIQDYITDLIHEIEGVTVKHMRVLQERNEE